MSVIQILYTGYSILQEDENMVNLIATDIDGTLLNNKGELHESFKEVILKLNNKNILFCVASGRLYGTLKKNFEHIDSKILFICHNGALIQYSDTNSAIFEELIDNTVASEIVDFLKTLNVEIYLCDKESAYLNCPSKAITEKFNECDVSIAEVDDLKSIQCNLYRIGVFQSSGIKQEIIKKLELRFGDKVSFQRGGDVWLDIMSKGIDKGKAIEIIQNKFNISKMETMVFGDYYNDIPMFSKAFYSYAMANSPEDVKKRANFIAPSNDENGVLQIITKEILKETF